MDNAFFTLRNSEKEISTEDALLDAWAESEKDPGYEKKEFFKKCGGCGAEDDMLLQEDVIVCKGCGEILGRPIDSSAEYRYFGIEDRGGRRPEPHRRAVRPALAREQSRHGDSPTGKYEKYGKDSALPSMEHASLQGAGSLGRI